MNEMSRTSAFPHILLFLLTAALFFQTAGHGFVSFDDNVYVYDNLHTAAGLTFESFKWAFTSFYQSNWHPLTWISHLIDMSLFGLNPAGHHLHNALLHALNACLVFLMLRDITGSAGKSLLAAALFAVHPMRAESVAWVAERKDVLSSLFGFGSILLYVRHVRGGSAGLPYGSVALYAASLMSKPTFVTLPVLLVILDGCAFRRFKAADMKAAVMEKLPFALLAAISSFITVLAQQKGGSVVALQAIPFFSRLGNAALSYSTYMMKTLFPINLSFYYPFPRTIPVAGLIASCLLLAGVTWLAFRLRSRVPEAAWGWGWFMIALLPMIGLIQVGSQGMADRYSYLPSVGLLAALVWSGDAVLAMLKPDRRLLVAASCVPVIICAAAGAWQVSFWKDSWTLYRRALAVNPDNDLALTQIGDLLRLENRCAEAIPYYNRSLQVDPGQKNVYNNIGVCLAQTGNPGDALKFLQTAVRMDPSLGDAWFNLGSLQAVAGNHADAVKSLDRAVKAKPDDAAALLQLAKSLELLDRTGEAAEYYRRARSVAEGRGSQRQF